MEGIFAAGAADAHLLNLKLSPVKLEPSDFKRPRPPTEERLALPSLAAAEASQDKENSDSGFHNRTLLEDSGYLTLQNSHIEEHKEDGYCNIVAVAHQGTLPSQQSSATKCQRRTSSHCLAASPTEGCQARAGTQSVSSTSSNLVSSPLPLLKFHEAVCEELTKDFRKNKR